MTRLALTYYLLKMLSRPIHIQHGHGGRARCVGGHDSFHNHGIIECIINRFHVNVLFKPFGSQTTIDIRKASEGTFTETVFCLVLVVEY